jgi:hypothetical protein
MVACALRSWIHGYARQELSAPHRTATVHACVTTTVITRKLRRSRASAPIDCKAVDRLAVEHNRRSHDAPQRSWLRRGTAEVATRDERADDSALPEQQAGASTAR